MRLNLSVNAESFFSSPEAPPIRGGLASGSETEKLIDKTVYFTTGAFQMSRA